MPRYYGVQKAMTMNKNKLKMEKWTLIVNKDRLEHPLPV
jgi:hypothetical protein